MDWVEVAVPLAVGVVAGVGSVAAAAVVARSRLQEIANSARAERWSALDQPRHSAYQKLWRFTWPLSRHERELAPPTAEQIASCRSELVTWYGESGYLLTRESTRRWRRLVDACSPFLAKHGLSQFADADFSAEQWDEVATATFAQSGIVGTRSFSWELPETIEEWRRSFPNDDYLRDLALLEILGSDLRASLARDLLARESARDGDGLTP